MTVYIDDMYLYPMGEFRAGPFLLKMSHMIADTEAELHVMAESLGVRRKWYQGDHYDVAKGMRAKAIKLGAVPITLAQCAAMSAIRGRDPNVQLVEPAKAEEIRAKQREGRRNEQPA